MSEVQHNATDGGASVYDPPAIEQREPVEGLLTSDGGGNLAIFVTS